VITTALSCVATLPGLAENFVFTIGCILGVQVCDEDRPGPGRLRGTAWTIVVGQLRM
jgi:hypothetical protein